MKIENEIEKLVKRVNLLETQNSRFKNLLDSALELTQQSLSGTEIHKDENEFLQETIRLIEDEKARMQEDLDLLSTSENEGFFYYVKQLENDNVELRKKVDVLLSLVQKQTKDIDQLKIEHMEFKFLLTQPNSNSEWLKNIIMIDNHISGSDGTSLMEQRFKLQRKIVNFEEKKAELLTVIDKMDFQKQQEIESPKSVVKADLEQALFRAIDDVAKKKYHDVHLKVFELEKERSQLLNDLQEVLDQSRKAIADEYSELQRKILEIESKKAELQLSMKCMQENEEVKKKFKARVVTDNEEIVALDTILNAFTNRTMKEKIRTIQRNPRPVRGGAYSSFGLPTCNIL